MTAFACCLGKVCTQSDEELAQCHKPPTLRIDKCLLPGKAEWAWFPFKIVFTNSPLTVMRTNNLHSAIPHVGRQPISAEYVSTGYLCMCFCPVGRWHIDVFTCVHACASLCHMCTATCLCGWVVSAQLCEESYSQEPRMVIPMSSLPSTSNLSLKCFYVASELW